MFRVLVIFCLWVSGACAADEIELVMMKRGDKLMVYIHNDSDQEIFINRRFSLGSSVDPSELVLAIKNDSGKQYPIKTFSKMDFASREDYIRLMPGDLVGRLIELERIVSYYELKNGRYSIKAIFKDSSITVEGAFDKQIESDPVWVTVN